MLGIDAGPAQDTAPLMLEHTAATEPGVAQEQLLTLQANPARSPQVQQGIQPRPTVELLLFATAPTYGQAAASAGAPAEGGASAPLVSALGELGAETRAFWLGED
jgi:hypothetical protein